MFVVAQIKDDKGEKYYSLSRDKNAHSSRVLLNLELAQKKRDIEALSLKCNEKSVEIKKLMTDKETLIVEKNLIDQIIIEVSEDKIIKKFCS